MTGLTTPQDIPTLSDMYAEGKLDATSSAKQEVDFKPSSAINDKVSLWQGDITKLQVDGVQNAANKALRGGGGIDGAIHRAAGPELLKACRALKGCMTGATKVTPGFDLPAKWVLHTVGPVYDDDEVEWSEECLQSCYETTLEHAIDNKVRTLALCGVSTGVYGYPLEDATHIALRTTREMLDANEAEFDRIIFCNFSGRDTQMYSQLAPLYFPPAPSSEASEEAPAKKGPVA